jgi:hypothetical protein
MVIISWGFSVRCHVILSNSHATDTSQQRPYHPRLLRLIVGLAMHLGLRAAGWLHGSARRAALGLRAGHHGAPRARAGWALTDLAWLVARADTRRTRRHGRLEDVAAHVRWRRALGLEHVAAHVGLRRAWRNRRLQNILGPIDLGALVALGSRARARARAITMSPGATTSFARGLCHIHEAFDLTSA